MWMIVEYIRENNSFSRNVTQSKQLKWSSILFKWLCTGNSRKFGEKKVITLILFCYFFIARSAFINDPTYTFFVRISFTQITWNWFNFVWSYFDGQQIFVFGVVLIGNHQFDGKKLWQLNDFTEFKCAINKSIEIISKLWPEWKSRNREAFQWMWFL